MKKRTPDKFWFPWWPDKWIFGSIRIECTLVERGIWVDLLSLASKDDGHIRANEETPYPLMQLSGMLLIPEDELKKAIEKFIELGKMTLTETGTLYVAKWDKYQFSDRHKRRVEESMSENPDMVSEKKTPILNKNTLKEKKKKQRCVSKVSPNLSTERWEGIEEKDVERWEKTYPLINVNQTLKEMIDWLLEDDNRVHNYVNFKSFISGWLRRNNERATKLKPKIEFPRFGEK